MIQFLESENFKLENAGQKAFQLNRLINRLPQKDFQVPKGFVISPEVSNDLELIRIELERNIERIGGYPVVARSSSLAEDLSNASFAGQYESILNISSLDELVAAIIKVRASADSERLKVYSKNKIDTDSSLQKLSVLVQKQVDCKWAGAIFTLNPITGIETEALLEWVDGLGDKLMDGKVQPKNVVLDIESGTLLREQGPASAMPLSLAQNILKTSLEIQAEMAAPQDIEWGIDASHTLWILQSRPITNYSVRVDVDEFTNADLKDGGVSARVCTPLMSSIYRWSFSDSMQKYLTDIKLLGKHDTGILWMSSFYGRIYWNASQTKKCLLKVPGFSEKKFDDDLGIQKKYITPPLKTPTNLITVLKAIPVAIQLYGDFSRQLKKINPFVHSHAEKEKKWIEYSKGIRSCNDHDFSEKLKELFYDYFYTTESFYFRTIFNNANAQTEFTSVLEKINKNLKTPLALPELITGLNDISHMQIQYDLEKLKKIYHSDGAISAAYLSELTRFQKNHYYHSNAELDITVKRWGEDLSLINSLVESSQKQPTAPGSTMHSIQTQSKRAEEVMQQVLGELKGFKNYFLRSQFHSHLIRIKSYLIAREKIRDLSSRSYSMIRTFLLETSRRLMEKNQLEHPDQVFMLEYKEILALFSSSPMLEVSAVLKNKIQMREKFYKGYRNFKAPNELGRGVVARSIQDYMISQKTLKGIGASPGNVTAKIRVIKDLNDIHELHSGDLLHRPRLDSCLGNGARSDYRSRRDSFSCRSHLKRIWNSCDFKHSRCGKHFKNRTNGDDGWNIR